MRPAGGGEKRGLHLKDKYFQAQEEVEDGAWGIRERQNDYSLELLDSIIIVQLKAVDFAAFNVAETLDVITTGIMEDIRKTNRGCPCERISISAKPFRRISFMGRFRLRSVWPTTTAPGNWLSRVYW